MELPQIVVAREIPIGTVDETSLFLVADLEARQLQGFVNHRERDLGNRRVLEARPDDAGDEGRAQTGAREGGYETPAGLIDILHAGKYRIKSNLFGLSNQ